MPAQLGPNRYGKVGVRVATVARHGDRHEFFDRTVDLRLEGDFEAAHAGGDNAAILPTDTMRASVYALAREHLDEPIEAFGLRLTEYLLDASPAATRADVALVEQPWNRILVDGTPHPHGFIRAEHRRKATVARTRSAPDHPEVSGGVVDLHLAKTTGSAFSGFIVDRYTTLRETDDRIMATSVTATWRYGPAGIDYPKVAAGARRAMVEAFALHDESQSVQHTMYAMGEAVLGACPDIEQIHFSLPNLHYIPVDLSPCGLDNPNAVFSAPDRPYGLIEGTVTRPAE
ncbi:MAG: urate oxidase [Actinomycetota bacterium]|nr:urate oxidase [Actinomycetota bacterium]